MSRPTDTLDRVALILLTAGGGFVSGQEIGERLGISRPAVAKHVRTLAELGYGVESKPRSGHRILARPDRLLAPEIADGLGADFLGRSIHHFERVHSTQLIARRLGDTGSPEGTIVVAEEQTAGRGRMGRDYFSPPGGIWCSIILRPQLAPTSLQPIALAAGLAVARAIHQVCGIRPTLKWPNDVLVRDRKVCGVLIEMSTEHDLVHYLVIGIGINANIDARTFPRGVRPTATSLQAETGVRVSRRDLLQRMLEALEGLYIDVCHANPNRVLTMWKEWPNVLSRRVHIVSLQREFEGIAEDVASDGALLVRLDQGSKVRVVSGDVHLRMTA